MGDVPPDRPVQRSSVSARLAAGVVNDNYSSAAGLAQRAIAAPSTRVVFSLESSMSLRLRAWQRQFTEMPARLTTPRAPSSSLPQSPSVSPSQRAPRASSLLGLDARVKMTTSIPLTMK